MAILSAQSSRIRPVLRPPGAEPGNIPRFIVPPGAATVMYVFSSCAFGLEVHYDGLRNRPCQAHLGCCWWDHALSLPKWEAWLHVGRDGDRVGNLLCITDSMARQVPSLGDGSADLRGLKLTLWRFGQTTHTRILLTVERGRCRLENLPVACDLPRRVQLMYDSPLRPATVARLVGEGRMEAPLLAEGEIPRGPDGADAKGPPEPGAE